jgi:uncharacterized protein YkwD
MYIATGMNTQIHKIFSAQNAMILIMFTITVFSLVNAGKVIKSVLGISYSVTDASLLEKVNEIRKQNGLPPLSLDNRLSDAALQKANDMIKNKYWAHFSPTGATPWEFINNNNYKYSFAGENLARGYTSTDDVLDAWMSSKTHKSNILSENYTDTGFAVVPGIVKGEDSVVIVEIFATPKPTK